MWCDVNKMEALADKDICYLLKQTGGNLQAREHYAVKFKSDSVMVWRCIIVEGLVNTAQNTYHH